MLKFAIKHAAGEDQVRHRQIPAEVVAKWSQEIDNLKSEISEILREEKEEKQVCHSCSNDGAISNIVNPASPRGNGAEEG